MASLHTSDPLPASVFMTDETEDEIAFQEHEFRVWARSRRQRYPGGRYTMQDYLIASARDAAVLS